MPVGFRQLRGQGDGTVQRPSGRHACHPWSLLRLYGFDYDEEVRLVLRRRPGPHGCPLPLRISHGQFPVSIFVRRASTARVLSSSVISPWLSNFATSLITWGIFAPETNAPA